MTAGANDCLPQIQCLAMRVAKLDRNGVPLPGAGNLYVTDNQVKIGVTPVYVDGTEHETKTGSGSLCLSYKAPDQFKRADVAIQLCVPDPELLSILTTGSFLSTGSGASARYGSSLPDIGPLTGYGVSIEYWTLRISDGVPDDTFPYVHHVLGRVKNIRRGEFVAEDAPQAVVLTGQAYENPNFYNGPAGDWPTAVASNRVHQSLMSNAIPTAQCGSSTLAAS